MIDLYQSRSLEERRLWAGAVGRLFQSLELQTHPAAPEVAQALAVFCRQQPQVSDSALALLAARSFCAAGDGEAAGRVLRGQRTSRACAGQWLDALSSGLPFPELYPLFVARVLRPQQLTSAGPLWVLDLNRLRRTEADRHELLVMQALRVLAERAANLWECSGGRGTLGVKGLARWASGAVGTGRLLDHLRAVLALRARKNGWDSIPQVLQCDL